MLDKFHFHYDLKQFKREIEQEAKKEKRGKNFLSWLVLILIGCILFTLIVLTFSL